VTDIAQIVISIFIVLAGIFGLVGSYGLIKLRDTMQRLHAPTKSTTLGIGSALIASMFYSLLIRGTLSFHELLITLFLFLTAPVSAHFIAKAYILRNTDRKDLPETGTAFDWSAYDDPPVPPKGD